MPSFSIGGLKFSVTRKSKQKAKRDPKAASSMQYASGPYKLHIGPGPNWNKPDNTWISVDIDPARGDISLDFNKKFIGFPITDNSVECIYASHTFEHISIFSMPLVMKECFRILKPDGILRIITPNPAKSLREYLEGNADFPLFKRRIERARKRGQRYTLFHALREDFISPAAQEKLLGRGSLAHQNAWDFDAMKSELADAGFDPSHVLQKDFQVSDCRHFDFEGTYPSEANAKHRSLYVEARK